MRDSLPTGGCREGLTNRQVGETPPCQITARRTPPEGAIIYKFTLNGYIWGMEELINNQNIIDISVHVVDSVYTAITLFCDSNENRVALHNKLDGVEAKWLLDASNHVVLLINTKQDGIIKARSNRIIKGNNYYNTLVKATSVDKPNLIIYCAFQLLPNPIKYSPEIIAPVEPAQM